MVINSAIMYVGLLVFIAGSLLVLEKYTKWKIFTYIPPLIWLYIILMILCTFGLFNSEECSNTYSSLKNNLLYGMIFVMLLRCNFKKLCKLGPKMAAAFFGSTFTIAIGFIIGFILFKKYLGDDSYGAVVALFASWVGGSANMAAMTNVFPVDPGAYACSIALDTVCYSIWIAFLLYVVKYEKKWNSFCKTDSKKMNEIASEEGINGLEKTKNDTSVDLIFLIGISLLVSAISQISGVWINELLKNIGLSMFDKGTCSILFSTIIGIICAMTPLGKMPAIDKVSDIYLYIVVALLASQASLLDLASAPVWIFFGLFALVIHMVLMIILSKIFHWDLCLVSTSSLANIGGAASAPIVACAYNNAFAGIGVLMGVLGAAMGNFLGILMGYILRNLL